MADALDRRIVGYRVVSRRFVKSFPVLSEGSQIETELNVHSLELAMPSRPRERHHAAWLDA